MPGPLPGIHGIDSDSVIQVTMPQTIASDSIVKAPVILYGSVQIIKPEVDELYAEANVLNPIPDAPTGLVAVDAGLGDAVNLSWASPAHNFNIYKKVGIVYTKLNPTIWTQGTSYLAGNLTIDIPVDIIVRAVNGLGQESGDSNVATVTPTLNTNASRFTNPTYEVWIAGIHWPTAILDTVELGFGSDFSTASFMLPVDPRTSVPDINEDVTVYINGRMVFKGFTSIKSDPIDISGLRVSYICHSNIIELTKTTFYSTDVFSTNTIFNTIDSTPENCILYINPATADRILTKLGVSGGPVVYPGHIDITDQTALEAAQLVLSRVGNYKIYHDMINDATSVYHFGTGGSVTRQFQFSKNIISYKIDTSYVDVVNKVTVIGAVVPIRYQTGISNPVAALSPDGRLELSFELSGNNIRDIQILGFQKAKPLVTFDDDVQVCLADFTWSQENTTPQLMQGFADSAFGWTDAQGNVLNSSNDKNLYPIVTGIKTYSPVLSGLGAKIVYYNCNRVQVFLSECPKIWYTITKSGEVNKATVGKGSTGTMSVTVLLGYDFYTGGIVAQYTVDTPPPVISAGSGVPTKSITDSQYQIIENSTGLPTNGYPAGLPIVGITNNTNYVLEEMRLRAAAELARAQLPPKSGTITIVGDETIDLRSSVFVEGQNLEISHVSHSFQNGFTTTVTLTNEPFVRNVILRPIFMAKPMAVDYERFRKSTYYDMRTESYLKIKRELASEKDQIDKQAPASGKYAIYQE